MDFVGDRFRVIAEHGSPARQALVERCRDELNNQGVAILEDFITPEAIRDILAQSEPLFPLGEPLTTPITPYFGKGKGEYPREHSANYEMERNYMFVPADLIRDTHPLTSMYTLPALREFLADVFNKPMYLYEDPFQTVNLKVEGDGGCQPFHFDSADGTITIMLQNATKGGEIEAVPNIVGDEERISQVIRENFDSVDRLQYAYKPGTMILFNGTSCLHRVTRCSGPQKRVIGIFQYGSAPGQKADDKKSATLYGSRVRDLIHRRRKFGSANRHESSLSQAQVSEVQARSKL
eukprot:TRINITY_DN9585_c0_g1_i2.p1 TRINITY_DN9585_c0_g1~~TRINITY_DN9585_c0_g1_i2.p1  ORF type:complete len:293 (-),score=45.97 TRINITY_DN9585_c0_g1_i2:19-897(-)